MDSSSFPAAGVDLIGVPLQDLVPFPHRLSSLDFYCNGVIITLLDEAASFFFFFLLKVVTHPLMFLWSLCNAAEPLSHILSNCIDISLCRVFYLQVRFCKFYLKTYTLIQFCKPFIKHYNLIYHFANLFLLSSMPELLVRNFDSQSNNMSMWVLTLSSLRENFITFQTTPTQSDSWFLLKYAQRHNCNWRTRVLV